MVITKFFCTFIILLLPTVVLAHQGKLNSSGCHNNSKTGQYECHGLKEKESKSKAKNSAKAKAKVSARDYNCDDFLSQSDAQKTFVKAGGPGLDVYDLDRDRDGIACEN